MATKKKKEAQKANKTSDAVAFGERLSEVWNEINVIHGDVMDSREISTDIVDEMVDCLSRAESLVDRVSEAFEMLADGDDARKTILAHLKKEETVL